MRDLPLILLLAAAGVLYVALLVAAVDRGWFPVHATAEEAQAVRHRPPWDVRR